MKNPYINNAMMSVVLIYIKCNLIYASCNLTTHPVLNYLIRHECNPKKNRKTPKSPEHPRKYIIFTQQKC